MEKISNSIYFNEPTRTQKAPGTLQHTCSRVQKGKSEAPTNAEEVGTVTALRSQANYFRANYFVIRPDPGPQLHK